MKKQELKNNLSYDRQIHKSKNTKFIFKVGMSMEDVEKGVIAMILNCFNGNKSKAAKILEVSRKTLYNKIKKYKL